MSKRKYQRALEETHKEGPNEFEFDQMCRSMAGRKVGAILNTLQQLNARSIIDPSKPQPNQEAQMVEILLGEVYVLQQMLMEFLVAGGMVRRLTKAELEKLMQEGGNDATTEGNLSGV